MTSEGAGPVGAEDDRVGGARALPVLVTGATGTLGRSVVRRLLDEGLPVRALSRHPRPTDIPQSPDVRQSPEPPRRHDAGPLPEQGTTWEGDPACEWATGDLTTGDGVDAALDGVTAVIHCATTLGRRDAEAARVLTDAARRHGSPHLVHVSIVGVDRVPLPYYRTKLATERIVEESGQPWTVLRATQFHDLVAHAAMSQRRLPCVLMPHGVSFQPVDAGEVAARLVELALGEAAGRVPDMGGPEIRSARELATMTLRAYGLRRRVVPLRLPGRTFRGYRNGGHLAPDHAVGRVTYGAYLARVTAGPAAVGRRGPSV